MATTINRTAANSNATTSAYFDDTNVHVLLNFLRIGPVLIYLRFATLMFGKMLMTSHPNLSDRSARYQKLVKRLIFISAMLLSMLIWLVETEFMGFFLKYVIVNIFIDNHYAKLSINNNMKPLFRKSPPNYGSSPPESSPKASSP